MKNILPRCYLIISHIKDYSFVCCIIILLSLISGCSSHSPDKIKIKKQLFALITKYNIPGAVISYKFKDQPAQTISVGYSSLSPKVKMQANSLFLVGSITKSFTAALILRLVEENKLQLNQSLGSIAKVYAGSIRDTARLYPSLSKMTLKQLLNHTSGVPQSINTVFFKDIFIKDPKKYCSAECLMKIAMQHPIYFKPGAKGMWSYTNTDYVLLGLVIESVTGKSLLYNFNTIFAHAHLNHIYFSSKGHPPLGSLKDVVSGYMPINSDDPLKGAFLDSNVVMIPGNEKYFAYQIQNAYNIFGPAGSGVISDTQALVEWYYTLFKGSLLKGSSKNEMLSVIRNGKYNNAGYGLGVTTQLYPKFGYTVSHDGLEPGYSTIVIYFKKYNLILAIATNSSNNRVSTFNVHNGAVIPGLVTHILPLLIKGLN